MNEENKILHCSIDDIVDIYINLDDKEKSNISIVKTLLMRALHAYEYVPNNIINHPDLIKFIPKLDWNELGYEKAMNLFNSFEEESKKDVVANILIYNYKNLRFIDSVINDKSIILNALFLLDERNEDYYFMQSRLTSLFELLNDLSKDPEVLMKGYLLNKDNIIIRRLIINYSEIDKDFAYILLKDNGNSIDLLKNVDLDIVKYALANNGYKMSNYFGKIKDNESELLSLMLDSIIKNEWLNNKKIDLNCIKSISIFPSFQNYLKQLSISLKDFESAKKDDSIWLIEQVAMLDNGKRMTQMTQIAIQKSKSLKF
jgi:hypothetical protein